MLVGISTICILRKFEIVVPLMSRAIIYVRVNVILDFPITYRNATMSIMICQSQCASLHKTVNMVVFFVKSKKGGHSCKCTELSLYRK